MAPKGAFVSNDGYLVLIRPSFSWTAEYLSFFTPDGSEELRVTISVPGCAETTKQKTHLGQAVWEDAHVRPTSGGPLWSWGSFSTFCECDSNLFCLRMAWGRRLVVNLDEMRLLDESEFAGNSGLAGILRVERESAMEFLKEFKGSSRDVPICHYLRFLGSLVVCGAHRLVSSVPHLRIVGAGCHSETTVCRVLGGRWNWTSDYANAVAVVMLRQIGMEPVSSPYRLKPIGETEPLEVAKRTAEVATLARSVHAGTSATDVLKSVGLPDSIVLTKRALANGLYTVWSEIWEYDQSDSTTRLHWTFPEDIQHDEHLSVEKVETLGPPDWEERLLKILHLDPVPREEQLATPPSVLASERKY